MLDLDGARRQLLLVAACLVSACAPALPRKPPANPVNVVMIVVDDLRPFIGAYGAPARTPNIDALVARGALFEHAYCQQTLCNPSRSSLLTGRRPDTIAVHDLETHFRARLPNIITLPQYFKLHGYRAVALGKIFHGGDLEDAQSWSERVEQPTKPNYGNRSTREALVAEAERRAAAGNDEPAYGPSWEASDVADDDLKDGNTAVRAIAKLRELQHGPFFFAVGFSRPHLPFVAPRRYFDLYPLEGITLAANPFPPADAPVVAVPDLYELRHYNDIPKQGPIHDDQARALIRAYSASVSYIDAQIGRVLDELTALGLRERTIVVLWGDHGIHLGEHGIWCKETVFEVAARAPLIISAPSQRARGAKVEALVELVDVYPTLAELARLGAPSGLEGISFVPLLDAPGRVWKTAAFTEQPRGDSIGRSMRTARHRYTEWPTASGKVQRELYDHQTDPDENVNLANRPELRALVEQLSAQLRAGWRAALPPGSR